MKLNAETNFLLQKGWHQAAGGLEVLAATVVSTILSALIAYFRCAELRFSQPGSSGVLCALGVLFTILVVLVTIVRRRNRRAVRGWIGASVLCAAGLVAGFIVGDSLWHKYTSSYFLYGTMPSYVNVDPGAEQGQTFMDAGTVYFKEDSFVLKGKALAFRNGKTYCVAPILRNPPAGGQSGPTSSGTVDFWAVGTDCCDRGGAFTCGDAGSKVARTGLRLLDSGSRSMYLLAVQEWSAGTGIPVRHPIFFHWVKDPISLEENIYSSVWGKYALFVVVFFLSSAVTALAINLTLTKLQVS